MSRYRWLVCSVLVMAGSVTQASAQDACDRACLRTMLDQYLAAVVKHDPSAAPLVVGFRQTENAINVRPGNGVWKTVTGLGKVQRRYLDPVTGQAAYYGTVEEGGNTAIVTVRVRVENRQLTEAEWHMARADDPGLNGPRQPGRPPANLHNPEYLAQNPPPDRVVPRNQRVDRATLARIVDSYFDAITSHDGSVALTHPGCGRVENGTPAPAGRFLPPVAPAQAAAGQTPRRRAALPTQRLRRRAWRTSTCRWSSREGFRWWTRRRRWCSRTPSSSAAPDRRRRAMSFSEWFVIDEAKIRTIYTAMFYPPPELAVPNWPPYEGNWPLPAAIVPAPAAPRQP